MKKSLGLILAAVLLFSFVMTGCGRNDNGTTTTSRTNTSEASSAERTTESIPEKASENVSQMVSDAESILPSAENGSVTAE
ncbi:MAG: hypothetical protein PUB85_03710 [Clostridia bacterium]|nr:hypothetical protein [Clostridia bacterium]